MSRYAQVDRSMWVDEKFLTLSAPKPNAQTLFVWLLTSPDASIIPGTYRIGLAGIAESLGWSTKTTAALLSELERAGMVRVDLKARLVWLPNALRRNAPKGPDNIAPWEKAWQELPECALKAEVWQAAWDHFSERDPKFVERFEALCPHPLARPQATPKPHPMGSASQTESQTHSRHTNNKILNPDPKPEQEQPKPPAAAAPVKAKLDDPNAQAILDALLACPSLARIAHRGTAEALVSHVNGGAKKLDWVTASVREYGEQEAILAGSPSGPTPDRELASGLRGFVAKARAPQLAAMPGTGGYPGHPRPAEAPSIASQLPFSRAPREAS